MIKKCWLAAFVLMLSVGHSVVAAQPPDWLSYSDAASGLALAYPPEWSAQSAQGLTLVQDPLSSVFLIFFRFPVDPTYTPDQCLTEVPQVFGGDLPGLALGDVIESTATNASASFAYQAPSEAGGGVVACQVRLDKADGLLVMMGGLESVLEQNAETLFTVADSIRVDGEALSSEVSSAVEGEQASAVLLGVEAGVEISNIDFVTYTDTLENAFTLDVPSGWSVTGGMADVAGAKRPALQALSPDGEIIINFGAAEINFFLTPSPVLAEAGYAAGSTLYTGEGVNVLVLDLATPTQFAETYLNLVLPQVCESFKLLESRERPDLSSTSDDGIQTSAGEAYFTCVLSDQQIKGYYFVTIVAVPDPSVGLVWMPDIQVGYYAAFARADEAGTILSRMVNSFLLDSTWVATAAQSGGTFEDNITQAQIDFADDPVGSQYMGEITDIMNDSISSSLSNWGE